MKSFIQFSIIGLLSFLWVSNSFAQNKGAETIEFKVEGVCGMCKERIEAAAYGKGVKFAEWDQDTRMLKVVYKPKKTTELEIHERIANAGHRTSKLQASEEAYKSLPHCCAYDDGVESH